MEKYCLVRTWRSRDRYCIKIYNAWVTKTVPDLFRAQWYIPFTYIVYLYIIIIIIYDIGLLAVYFYAWILGIIYCTISHGYKNPFMYTYIIFVVILITYIKITDKCELAYYYPLYYIINCITLFSTENFVMTYEQCVSRSPVEVPNRSHTYLL